MEEFTTDKRMRVAVLTPRGKQKLLSSLPIWSKAQARLANELAAGEVDRLVGLLQKVTGRLEDR